MIRFLLVNNNRSLLSNDLVEEIAGRHGFDFVVATEPNVYAGARRQWVSDTAGTVAIRRATGSRGYGLFCRAEGVVAIELDNYVLFGIYISPNITVVAYQNKIIQLQRLVMQSPKKVIILGDFNCKTVAAGAHTSNARGNVLEDFLVTTNTTCLNDGTPTFSARGHESVLDLIILDGRMALNQAEIKVLDQEIGSDHYAVSLVLKEHMVTPSVSEPVRKFTERQIQRIVDSAAHKIMNNGRLDPEFLQEIIKGEIANIPVSAYKYHPVYWWNQDIANQRTELQSHKRTAQRLRTREGNTVEDVQAMRAYRAARKRLNYLIKSEKKASGKNCAAS
ncbi:uncharacterized protein LOC142317617 [Lycorma delicatula]|uniref:uncharacterized protein LOC142317617 n=1 Tax=Lycorma delicatula TaxID=130591 RepID=UPI003F5137FB